MHLHELYKKHIVVHPNAVNSVRQLLEDRRREYASTRNEYLRVSNKSTLDFDTIPRSADFVTSKDEMALYTSWLLKSVDHATYIADHTELFYDLVSNKCEQLWVKRNGLESVWTCRNLSQWLNVAIEAVEELLGDAVYRVSKEDMVQIGLSTYNRIVWAFKDYRLSAAYLEDTNVPILTRAVWGAKRQALIDCVSETYDVSVFSTDKGEDTSLLMYINLDNSALSLRAFNGVVKTAELYNSYKADVATLNKWRKRVLEKQSDTMRQDLLMRKQVSARHFTQYWDSIKQAKRQVRPTLEEALNEWNTIPLAPIGTTSSRTWGIEVETVRANATNRPAGWQQVHDGSLESEGECDCSCDYCYDGNHSDCYNEDDECGMNDVSCAEFVSPILSHYNSTGLQQLCTDLGPRERNTSPGIHVHVGADNLTVTDVARLLSAYSIVAPLIQPLYFREVDGYCKEMNTDNIQYWLSAVRNTMRETGQMPDPRVVAENQPANRYHDVNVHALFKHGTIEFRSMGPRYDYAHLVRWAWFCREMVNVSTLGLDQTVWLRCKSVADVIAVLTTYGSESQPNTNNALETPALELIEN